MENDLWGRCEGCPAAAECRTIDFMNEYTGAGYIRVSGQLTRARDGLLQTEAMGALAMQSDEGPTEDLEQPDEGVKFLWNEHLTEETGESIAAQIIENNQLLVQTSEIRGTITGLLAALLEQGARCEGPALNARDRTKYRLARMKILLHTIGEPWRRQKSLDHTGKQYDRRRLNGNGTCTNLKVRRAHKQVLVAVAGSHLEQIKNLGS